MVGEANGASASLLTGCSRQRLEAHADDAQASSGRNRRRHCIRHARNRAGRPAVRRRSLRNGAFWHHPCILPLNARCQPTLWCAVCLLLCRRRRLPRRLTRLRSCRQRWLRRERRAVCACVRCLCLLACSVASNASGAGRRSGAYFGRFAAAVCVQVVCWVFDRAEKVPPAVAEAGATSSTCVRALSALAGVCRRVQTRGSERG